MDDDDNEHDTMREPLDSFEEKRKRKLEAKQEAWLAEISQKCQPLKPYIISRLTHSHFSVENLAKIEKCTGVLLVQDPLEFSLPPQAPSMVPNLAKDGTRIINKTALPYFVQYIHELCIGVDRAAIQFYKFWNEQYLPTHYPDKQPDNLENLKVSKGRLIKTIHCIANKVEQGFQKVWLVKEEYLSTDVLDTDVKQEIRQLFPAKISNKQVDTDTSKATNNYKSDVIILDSSSPVQNPRPVEKQNEIKRFTSPVMKLQFAPDARPRSSPSLDSKIPPISVALTKIPSSSTNSNPQTSLKLTKTPGHMTKPNVQTLLNDVNKSAAASKRKSLSEMRTTAVKPCPESPMSPPDVEMSEIKRVKLSTSNTSINSQEIETVDSPPREPRRRLVLGAQQVDSKGSIVHIWK